MFYAFSRTSACLIMVGCSSAVAFDNDAGTSGGDGSIPATRMDDSGTPTVHGSEAGGGDGAAAGTSVIYANTDTQLYAMDPSTEAVTLIGTFDDGTTKPPPMTDLAVNAAGDIWVNSETAIYTATLPASPGPVKIKLVAMIALKTSQKFYALGFAPAGVLGTGETLVAGDDVGELYAVETTGSVTDLGSFGSNGSGGNYELSGDIVFYTYNGSPRGLATVRLSKGTTTTTTNDILAEVDVPAMSAAYASKTRATTLKKQFLGTGTGFGRLFGVGAWADSVYAFSRADTTSKTAAALIKIDVAGVGSSIKTFPAITSGWSGAGVTTSALVTIAPN